MFNFVEFDGVKGIEIEAFNSMCLHGNGFNPFEIEEINLVEFD